MNVTELARQLKTTREELLAKLPSLGFDIGARAIKIDNLVAERIKESWSQSLRKERLTSKMAEAQAQQASAAPSADAKSIILPERITVNDFAVALGIGAPHLIGYLLKNGIMAALNQQIDFETASLAAEDFGFKVVRAEARDELQADKERTEFRTLKQSIAADDKAEPRPPVVVIMGHVDHGKTTLLDAIRQTNVVASESGGITQHIGAYQVEVPQQEEPLSRGDSRGIPAVSHGIPRPLALTRDDNAAKGRIITFLDTPGHEAFQAMRERGGQVADVAILVVAADDGLRPQTLESINVIQRENLPFVVAINKIDKPGADIDKVKKELSEINLVPEDWGGKTICAEVSAKQKTNIAELLDTVLLVADMEKFSANPHCPAVGVIIESHIDTGEGPVATVLVNAGTLRVGDQVVIGNSFGRVKALKDWRGRSVKEVLPATPVKILGLKSAPRVGEILRVEIITRDLKKQSKKQYSFASTPSSSPASSAAGENGSAEKEAKAQIVLNIILKADVLGSLEAVAASIKKLEQPEVGVSIIKQGLGNITETDIGLAESTNSLLYGFNVQLATEARRLSYSTTAKIKMYKIIYELLDDLKKEVNELIKPEIVEVPQGELLVLQVFKDSRAESIVGGRVGKAKISMPLKFRLLRNNELLDEGKVLEIQQNRQSVNEAKEGVECGLKVSGVKGIKAGDVLTCFREEEKRHVPSS